MMMMMLVFLDWISTELKTVAVITNVSSQWMRLIRLCGCDDNIFANCPWLVSFNPWAAAKIFWATTREKKSPNDTTNFTGKKYSIINWYDGMLSFFVYVCIDNAIDQPDLNLHCTLLFHDRNFARLLIARLLCVYYFGKWYARDVILRNNWMRWWKNCPFEWWVVGSLICRIVELLSK